MPEISYWHIDLKAEFLRDTHSVAHTYYRSFYCTVCGKTGHKVKGKEKIRVHKSTWLQKYHTELASKYQFSLPAIWLI